jgi:hypothetical protein
MRGIVLSAFVIAIFTGCLSAPAPILSGSAGTSGGSGPGSAGDTGTGGITSGSAGATGSAGMMEGAGGNASGAAGTGGTDTGAGGTSTGSGGSGGAAGTAGSGGSSAGGAAGTAGTTGRGGTTGTGGMAGTTGPGGTTGAGGMAGAAGRGGVGGTVGPGGATGTAGTTGTGGTASACAPVDGLRVDDPCGSLLSGNACLHKGKTTDDGTPFSAMKAVTMGGTTGTTYQVKIHFRGVTEPTHIMSGTPGTPANFLTGGTRYPDGSQESTYQQWRLTTTNPNQHYYLNAFNSVGLAHIVELIDYDQTIPIAAGATVTLDVYDGNAHEISNTVNTPPLAPSGVPGSMSSGQFMQLNVDGCN